MKKSIALITLTSTMLLVGCKNESAEREKIAQENIDSYSKTWELVINEGKVDVLDTAFAPEIVLHTVPEIKGIAKSKAYYAYFVTGFSNRKFIVKEIFASGDKLTKYWQFKGLHSGTFFGIPATGKSVDVIGCTIAKVVAGKIVEEQDFFDNYAFLQQIGIIH